MMIFKGKSLEGFITFWLALFTVLFLSLVYSLMWKLGISDLYMFLTLALLAIVGMYAIIYFRTKVMSTFRRALMHLEAVRQEDYKQYAKAVFPQGVVGSFHQNLIDFSDNLSEKKQRYDQHAFLVYQLIDQLETPVLVFNQKDQLSYANGAFSQLYDSKHWQMFRYASPTLLGLNKGVTGWQLQHQSERKNQQWQISHSMFIDEDITHQLLVFTNIESAVRISQVKAWQQMINVMGHEIRNSLTPVSTIAESLAERAGTDRDKDALALISERCLHLQDFINRYASLSKRSNLNYRNINTDQFTKRLCDLFAQYKLEVVLRAKHIWADQSLLEQMLINLIKNAFEAEAEVITLEFSQNNNCSIIKVIDDGYGFANLDNVFVPLFSTKQGGQGIGLSLCQHIIEQHQGGISLTNNSKGGVTVEISLPLRKP